MVKKFRKNKFGVLGHIYTHSPTESGYIPTHLPELNMLASADYSLIVSVSLLIILVRCMHGLTLIQVLIRKHRITWMDK